MRVTTLALASLLAIGVSAGASAQMKRPTATLTPTVETAPVRAGAPARLSLRVALPADVHVQSDKPKDPSLIPTVLTVDAPAGVTVDKTTYPASSELVQAGQREPLLVLGPEFVVDVQVALAPDVPTGTLTIPLRLRYQACDAKVCYPPARAEAQWTVAVQ